MKWLYPAFALLLATACEKSDGLPPTVHVKASEIDAGIAPDDPQAAPRLEWPGDFSLWRGTELLEATDLPKCPSPWFNRRLDEEFSVWKCSDYPDVSFGPGELIVHTLKDRVFMVTTNVSCATPADCTAHRTRLQEINKDRNLPVPSTHARAIQNIWNLTTYRVALATSDTSFSVVYLDQVSDLDALARLVKQQNNPPRLDRDYKLGDLRYRVTSVATLEEVGRGRDRWSARKDSVFVVITYEIENLGKALLQDDPAVFSVVAADTVYEPDAKAEENHVKGDRTGLLITPIEYKSRKPRAHVFEVKRSDMARPGLLVIKRGDEKLVYPLN